MSNPRAWASPSERAICAAASAPPAGPDSMMRTGCSRTLSIVAKPELESMMKRSPAKPESRMLASRRVRYASAMGRT